MAELREEMSLGVSVQSPNLRPDVILTRPGASILVPVTVEHFME